jgi:hypothetical protein
LISAVNPHKNPKSAACNLCSSQKQKIHLIATIESGAYNCEVLLIRKATAVKRYGNCKKRINKGREKKITEESGEKLRHCFIRSSKVQSSSVK